MRKKVYIAAGYNTTYMGPGREEFDHNHLKTFDQYLKETAEGTLNQLPNKTLDEGIIGSFMSGRFIKQANLAGFLPFMTKELRFKPCTAVEGACGTGGRAIAIGVRSILSEISDSVFIAAFEMQNTMKSIYGADVLAGASYYQKMRKSGKAHFFPSLFSDRAGAYLKKVGEEGRKAMAKWYEQAIKNAKINPKAQEYHNKEEDLFSLAMSPPNPKGFIEHLNYFDCSKVSDGASSLVVLSEEGLNRSGLKSSEVVEVIAMGEAEEDITEAPHDLTKLSTTEIAVKKALANAKISIKDIGVLEIHDCFSITALLSIEAIGIAKSGQAPFYILEEKTSRESALPTNLSGGLIGFGHPTGASGVRQMVDLLQQLTHQAPNQANVKKPYGMMISMGGNDKTVTCIIVKAV